jgi:chemotaxis protein MotB
MKYQRIVIPILSSIILISCVSNKKFERAESQSRATRDSLMGVNSNLMADLNTCKDSTNAKDKRIAYLQDQNAILKQNNNQAIMQLQNLSVITSTQAESIKKSLDNIGAKDTYIMALVMNLKGAIGNMADEDINIKVDKGVVFIDISDKLLFKSGSYDITPRAKEVLGKVATVLKNQPDLEFMVEGHTDNIPYKRPPLIDNWDLSVKRATAVVRILQNEYGLPPYHITAAGRSEYQPVTTNDTNEGRAMNRRTRIVILPQLDQFFKLLETK